MRVMSRVRPLKVAYPCWLVSNNIQNLATGAHECVGYTGLALGGGHGRYEGKYGLVSDNIVSLQVVLSDGREIQVDDNNYPDLFWAMKGAGHNFGIVTALTAKIYPIEHQTWHYHNYYWSGDKLEEIFEKLNKFHDYGKTPVGMGVNFGSLSINPTYSNDSVRLAHPLFLALISQRRLPLTHSFTGHHQLELRLRRICRGSRGTFGSFQRN